MTDQPVPQAAVDAVLEEWERRYFAGEEEYKPDPSHPSVVRDALTVAAPYLATQPEAPADPQQPATAELSDAHGQREQLRDRLSEALRSVVSKRGYYDVFREQADAVLNVVGEAGWEQEARRADFQQQRAEAAEQERDNLRAHVDADHQVLAEVRKLADAAADMHVVGNKYERGRHDLAAAILEVITGSADE